MRVYNIKNEVNCSARQMRMSSLEAKAKVDNYDDEIYGDMLL